MFYRLTTLNSWVKRFSQILEGGFACQGRRDALTFEAQKYGSLQQRRCNFKVDVNEGEMRRRRDLNKTMKLHEGKGKCCRLVAKRNQFQKGTGAVLLPVVVAVNLRRSLHFSLLLPETCWCFNLFYLRSIRRCVKDVNLEGKRECRLAHLDASCS